MEAVEANQTQNQEKEVENITEQAKEEVELEEVNDEKDEEIEKDKNEVKEETKGQENTPNVDAQIAEPFVVPPVPYEETPRQANEENQEEEQPSENILWRGVKFVGVGLYKIAYYTGEFLADLLGITRPRYEYALREYYERERQRVLQERMERGEVDENGNEIEQPNTA